MTTLVLLCGGILPSPVRIRLRRLQWEIMLMTTLVLLCGGILPSPVRIRLRRLQWEIMLMTTLVLLCGGILPSPVRIRLRPTAVGDNVNDDPYLLYPEFIAMLRPFGPI